MCILWDLEPTAFFSLLFSYLNIHFKERKHGPSTASLSRQAGTSLLPLSLSALCLVGRVHRFICIEPRQECRGQPWHGAQLCSHPTSPLVLFRLNFILQGQRKFLLNIYGLETDMQKKINFKSNIASNS